MAAYFSYLNGRDARFIEGVIVEPTKAEMVEHGAAYVQRANDNEGTYILNSENIEIGYVPNTAHYEDSDWLYFSSDVKEYYGL